MPHHIHELSCSNFTATLLCKTFCARFATTSLTGIPFDFNITVVILENRGSEISLARVPARGMGGIRSIGEMVDRSRGTTGREGLREECRNGCIRQLLEREEATALASRMMGDSTYTHPRRPESLGPQPYRREGSRTRRDAS